MTMTISVGWWMIPGAITLFSICWVTFGKGFLDRGGSDIGSQAVSGLLDLLLIGALTIVCLIAWLIWALLA